MPIMILSLLTAPHLLWACAVCFGQSDAPMAVGTNMGIFLMLGVTVAVLAAFGAFFVYLARRMRIAEGEPPASIGTVPAGRHAEGTL
jgi:hypothetical protein